MVPSRMIAARFTPYLLLLAVLPARAGDAIDTRVTFTVADDDIQRGPEDTTTGGSDLGSPSVPNFVPGSRNRLFFDDHEKRDTGFENLTHFVLYAHQPGFFEGLDTEAALVLRAEVLTDPRRAREVTVTDDGSYLKLTRQASFGSAVLTAFPLSADRFRLGYSYDMSWGGRAMFRNATVAPGLRAELNAGPLYLFAGAKTARVQVVRPDNSTESDTIYGLLGGGGLDAADELRMEIGAGYFYRGTLETGGVRVVTSQGVEVPPWQALGGSAQVTYHVGIPIGTAIDFRLYKNDPLQREVFFTPETYGEGVSFLVQSEVTVAGQTLNDVETPNTTVMRWGTAGDVAARLKMGRARLNLLGVYRDLGFIGLEEPLMGFSDFADGTVLKPEMFGSIGADYYIESWHFTPGVVVGAQRPASYTSGVSAGNNPPPSLGQQTMVVRSPQDQQPLDAGDKVRVGYALELTFLWNLSEIMQAAGDVQFSYDPNRRRFVGDPNGVGTYEPQAPEIIGFDLMLRARF